MHSPVALATAYLRENKLEQTWIDKHVPENLRKAIDYAVVNHWDAIA